MAKNTHSLPERWTRKTLCYFSESSSSQTCRFPPSNSVVPELNKFPHPLSSTALLISLRQCLTTSKRNLWQNILFKIINQSTGVQECQDFKMKKLCEYLCCKTRVKWRELREKKSLRRRQTKWKKSRRRRKERIKRSMRYGTSGVSGEKTACLRQMASRLVSVSAPGEGHWASEREKSPVLTFSEDPRRCKPPRPLSPTPSSSSTQGLPGTVFPSALGPTVPITYSPAGGWLFNSDPVRALSKVHLKLPTPSLTLLRNSETRLFLKTKQNKHHWEAK